MPIENEGPRSNLQKLVLRRSVLDAEAAKTWRPASERSVGQTQKLKTGGSAA